MEAITLVAASWASGINAYLTILVIGAGGKLGWVDAPDLLAEPVVLISAAVMFAIEFVVDKVPFLDSIWDIAHTVIRPSIGAVLSAAIAGAELGDLEAGLLGAGIALTGHIGKASSRLAINSSPEPVSNVLMSAAEDGLVVTLLSFAMAYPTAAAVITAVFMILGLALAFVTWKLARRGIDYVRNRSQRPRRPGPQQPGPQQRGPQQPWRQ